MARKLRYTDAVPARLRQVAAVHGLTQPDWYVPAGGGWLDALDHTDRTVDEGSGGEPDEGPPATRD